MTDDASKCPGQFSLDGLLRLRERGHTTYPCTECTWVHEISALLTGFAAPRRALAAELDQIHYKLAGIESGMIRMETRAAATAESVRRVLRVVSEEVTDCPHLFTLVPLRPAGVRRGRFYQHHFRMTLWCEHPGYWHPWAPASYQLDPPKDWFIKVSPYATLVFRTLQLVVPLVGSIAVASLPLYQLEQARAQLEMMTTVVNDLPSNPELTVGEDEFDGATNKLTIAEGHALRALRAILLEHDPKRTFGLMRRVKAPSGEFLWVCTDHYVEYDPGLPIVP
jgi:hypothetical protein